MHGSHMNHLLLVHMFCSLKKKKNEGLEEEMASFFGETKQKSCHRLQTKLREETVTAGPCPQTTECPLIRGALIHLLLKIGHWVSVSWLLSGVHFWMEVYVDPPQSNRCGFCNSKYTQCCKNANTPPNQKIYYIQESVPSLWKSTAHFHTLSYFIGLCY